MEPADSGVATPQRGRQPLQPRTPGTGSQLNLDQLNLGPNGIGTPARRPSQFMPYETPSRTKKASSVGQRGEFSGTPLSRHHARIPTQGLDAFDEDREIHNTNIKVGEFLDRFSKFIREFSEDGDSQNYMDLLREIATNGEIHYCVEMTQLHSFDPWLYKSILAHPKQTIPLLDDQLMHIAVNDLAMEDPLPVVFRPFRMMSVKVIRDLDPSDLHQIVAVTGMIIRTSAIFPELKIATFECEKCGYKLKSAPEQGRVTQPSKCDECGEKECMKTMHTLSIYGSKQVIRFQENHGEIPEGETAHTVVLFAYDQMVDVCKPGDRVTITGMYSAEASRLNPNHTTVHSIYKTFIEILHVEVLETAHKKGENDENENSSENAMNMDGIDDPDGIPDFNADLNLNDEDVDMGSQPINTQDATQPSQGVMGGVNLEARLARDAEMRTLGNDPHIYNRLVGSLAPSIWEMEDVKKGVLCQLFGGTIKEGSLSGKVRNDINILLVGDPGVSKSQLLTYVHKVAPRGVYTCGRGSSAVGLTAYVTKDPTTKEMVLESGALVLSDQGICCIDEFDKMSENAQGMLHEVMEQQTVSVAKAGIVSTLNARTSVLASANPVGSKYNPDMTVVANIKLPPSLISRFDLIYILLDVPNKIRDQRLAKHLIAMTTTGRRDEIENVLPPSKLREYIAYCRENCRPVISEEAGKLLVQEYLAMRREGANRNTITATPRQLESFMRLSEALAKMRLQDTVEAENVKEAVRLVKSALGTSFIDKDGRMDLESMYTGVSSDERTLRQHLGDAVKKILQRENLSFQKLYEKISEESSIKVSQQQLRDALKFVIGGEIIIEKTGDIRLRN